MSSNVNGRFCDGVCASTEVASEKECCEKTFHKRPSFRLTPTGASSVLGSARLWRVGDRILRSRTFVDLSLIRRSFESDKSSSPQNAATSTLQACAPQNSTPTGRARGCALGYAHYGKNRNNQERPLHRDGRSGIDRRGWQQVPSRKTNGALSLRRFHRETILRRHTLEDRLSKLRRKRCRNRRNNFLSFRAKSRNLSNEN